MEGRPGFVIAAWCGSEECEAQIKAETQATLRNIPFGALRRCGEQDLREVRQSVDWRSLVRESVLSGVARVPGAGLPAGPRSELQQAG